MRPCRTHQLTSASILKAQSQSFGNIYFMIASFPPAPPRSIGPVPFIYLIYMGLFTWHLPSVTVNVVHNHGGTARCIIPVGFWPTSQVTKCYCISYAIRRSQVVEKPLWSDVSYHAGRITPSFCT